MLKTLLISRYGYSFRHPLKIKLRNLLNNFDLLSETNIQYTA